MTHKNPELRAAGAVSDKKEAPAVKSKPGALSQAQKKPPKFELEDGTKWLVVSHPQYPFTKIRNIKRTTRISSSIKQV